MYMLEDINYVGVEIAESLTCHDCKKVELKKPQPTPIVPIPVANSIREGLKQAQASQLKEIQRTKSGERPMGTCKECLNNKKYYRQSEVTAAPKLLLLQLNRWDTVSGSISKN